MAIRPIGKTLRRRNLHADNMTNEMLTRISQLDKNVMMSERNKLAKQVLESLKAYSDLGLYTWESITVVEDIVQDVLRKWEVYHDDKGTQGNN